VDDGYNFGPAANQCRRRRCGWSGDNDSDDQRPQEWRDHHGQSR